MIPIEPWLVPPLVMAPIVGIVALTSGINKVRPMRTPSEVFGASVRILAFGLIAVVLFSGAVYTLIYGEEAVTRLTAFATFVTAVVSALCSVLLLLNRRQPRHDGRVIQQPGEAEAALPTREVGGSDD